ncbi:hypothetical protein [Actinomycetospora sp. CA-053990]|uniref:hypothetical protein n=1 Tax=Actinomycetospora sp. CA-053990 TaxID=3239891 RepID=UPI003D949C9B
MLGELVDARARAGTALQHERPPGEGFRELTHRERPRGVDDVARDDGEPDPASARSTTVPRSTARPR